VQQTIQERYLFENQNLLLEYFLISFGFVNEYMCGEDFCKRQKVLVLANQINTL
jgi:hypothetical protein